MIGTPCYKRELTGATFTMTLKELHQLLEVLSAAVDDLRYAGNMPVTEAALEAWRKDFRRVLAGGSST